jgi:hypothetical protein
MANIPISNLPLVTMLAGDEVMPLVQGGTTKRAYVAQLAQYASVLSINLRQIIASSTVPVLHTGTVDETVLATISLPANAMGPNGRIQMKVTWTYTGSVASKTPRVRFGGLLGTAFYDSTQTINECTVAVIGWTNRGVSNVQIGDAPITTASGVGSVISSPPIGAIDTTEAVDIVITGHLTDVTEIITLEQYLVELIYGP